MLPKQPNKSLIDGIRCLQGVASVSDYIGVSELAELLDMETTRVHRLLRSLAHLGFTQQNSSRKYGPGPAIYALAAQTLYASHFIRDALGPLEKLRARQPNIVAMGVVWNRTVSYLYHAKRGTPLERAIGTFGIWEASDSGIGLAVMARNSDDDIRTLYEGHEVEHFENGVESLITLLQCVREQGYAMIEPHSDLHNTTIALPLKSNPIVALGISGKSIARDGEELLQMLRETIEQIDENASVASIEPAQNRFGKAI